MPGKLWTDHQFVLFFSDSRIKIPEYLRCPNCKESRLEHLGIQDSGREETSIKMFCSAGHSWRVAVDKDKNYPTKRDEDC